MREECGVRDVSLFTVGSTTKYDVAGRSEACFWPNELSFGGRLLVFRVPVAVRREENAPIELSLDPSDDRGARSEVQERHACEGA